MPVGGNPLPRQQIEEPIEKPSIIETNLYDIVERFFKEEKECEKTGSAINPISLNLFGGTIYPDVFGISSPMSLDFKIFMAEGKRTLKGRTFDECKGQAISLQRFADYVYLFFPKDSWNQLDKEERSDIENECKILKLGLLLVDENSCKEVLKADPNLILLKEEKRVVAKNKIIQFFPDFLGSTENAGFFEKYPKLADSLMKESCSLVGEYCLNAFTEVTPVKKQSIKPWYRDDTFEFYLWSRLRKRPNVEVLVIMKPFGSSLFETNYPTLLIQERYKYSDLKRKALRSKLVQHMNECIKRKCRVDIGYYEYYYDFSAEDVFNDIEAEGLKDSKISIFDSIKILGVEKEAIKKEVGERLLRIIEFSNSLK